MDGSQVKISFDDEYKLRILDAGKYKQAEELDKECSTFMDSECLEPYRLLSVCVRF